MATKLPLVISLGQLQQLQAGDALNLGNTNTIIVNGNTFTFPGTGGTLSTGGGGGSVNMATILSFAAAHG